MANFAKVHEKTRILNEDWKKLRVQPVQLMKPVSGHPFLKQVGRVVLVSICAERSLVVQKWGKKGFYNLPEAFSSPPFSSLLP